MLGDEEADTATAQARLREALTGVGVKGDLAAIADGLLTASPATWSKTAEAVSICEHPSSARNPASPCALKPADLQTLSRVLQP
ncbi:hypothetical protein ADL15_21585 [Actinoplanes awajinensis subsp. mycoplanecinus]|uniref:Uncharacterized protein n=2 Tax=Actinoplanes awajinensis TaxID=135946 RepID=A0A117MRG2_9ACTN|nr:hypothetical protein ADL15_21585 [Actinoplanes awajinensis subsp. mycoplanecinus]